MKRCKTIAMVTLIIMGLTSQRILADNQRTSRFVADNHRKSPFVGLWEGIDPDDGGDQKRSITLNEDGTLSLTGSSTYFSLCGGTDRGVIRGTGEIQGTVLDTKVTLKCFDNGSLYNVKANYELDWKNDTIIERTDLRTENNKPPIVFHLMSR